MNTTRLRVIGDAVKAAEILRRPRGSLTLGQEVPFDKADVDQAQAFATGYPGIFKIVERPANAPCSNKMLLKTSATKAK